MSRRKKIIYGILAFIGLLIIITSFSENQKSSQQSKISDQPSLLEKLKEVRFYSLDDFLKVEEQIKKQHPELKIDYRTIKPEKATGETHFIDTQIDKKFLVIALASPIMGAYLNTIINCDIEKIDCFAPERQRKIAEVFSTIFKTTSPTYTGDITPLFKAIFNEVKQSTQAGEFDYSKEHVVVGRKFLMNISCSNVCEDKKMCKVSYCSFSLYPFTSYLQYHKQLYKEETIDVFELNAKGKLVEKKINI